MFAALFSPCRDRSAALLSCARAFSPRVEPLLGGCLVLFDAAGLGRIVGDPPVLAREIAQALAQSPIDDAARAEHPRALPTPRLVTPAIPRPDEPQVAIAPSRTAALLLAIGQRGTTIVPPGRSAATVGALTLGVFDRLAQFGGGKRRPCPLCVFCTASHRQARTRCGQPGGACTELPTLRRWGLTTLGELAALPPADVAARLGQAGVALQRLARAADAPLVPIVEETRFEASLDLEWPIETLEPLAFVLSRLLDPLSTALERADRGAAALVTELVLVRLPGTTGSSQRPTHVRRLELPAPMRDARVLRTLILLDLESHPPPAGIDRVSVRLEPTPARIVQFSLLERAGPQPETVATLLSRLTALAGEGRVGSPRLVDSHKPGDFAMARFGDPASASLVESTTPPLHHSANHPVPVLRRFRPPVAARVVLDRGRPIRVTTDRHGLPGGGVKQCSGPWRGSGGWWIVSSDRDAEGAETQRNAAAEAAWDYDEYDVALTDGAAYRICRDRHADRWFVAGVLD